MIDRTAKGLLLGIMSPVEGFFGERESKKVTKSRERGLKFFLFPGRKSIYQVKNGKRGLNIFREVGGGNDGFLEGRKVFRRGAY